MIPPTTETTPLDLSDPVLQTVKFKEISQLKEEVRRYQQELLTCMTRMERLQVMLEIIMTQVGSLVSTTQASTN